MLWLTLTEAYLPTASTEESMEISPCKTNSAFVPSLASR